MATRQDADTKGREEDTDHEKHHPLIARDELAERADAKDDGKQHYGHARREDEGGGREPPASALDGNGNEGGQKRDHATWREQGQDASQKGRHQGTRVDEGVHGSRRQGGHRLGLRSPSLRRNAPSEIRP